VTSETRLAAVATALDSLGLRALVMGGHAVRFHGVDRSTVDYDFCLATGRAEWSSLGDLLPRSPLFAAAGVIEGPSWRPGSFRRFVIGSLPDHREERLEVWRRNHLLAPFEELFARRAEGTYGDRTVRFLGLDDLIRSKETEREDDWRDVGLLEEIADERRLVAAGSPSGRVNALAALRSRRGAERARAEGLLADPAVVSSALVAATNPITQAYLLPSAARAGRAEGQGHPALRSLESALREVPPGGERHFALVEAVRRLYRRDAMASDRADKEREAGGSGEE